MIYQYKEHVPQIGQEVWIAPTAHVIGKVSLADESSMWFGAVARGDNEHITIGAASNVQENVSLHTDMGFPLTIGARCTIGHNAIVHGAMIEDEVLIGMGAIVMNGAQIKSHSIVAAGALVPEGKSYHSGSLIMGSPAKAVRSLKPEEIERLLRSAENYRLKAKSFASELHAV